MLAKRVKDVLWLKERQEDVVIAILIGNNVVNLLASSIATVTLYNLFGDAAVALATGIMTFLVNNQGKVYQKDLGEKSLEIVKAMQVYDPDETWSLVEEEEAEAPVAAEGEAETPAPEGDAK